MSNFDNADATLIMDRVSYRYMPGTPFERLALDDISFSITKGQRVALVGQTGSGKSTLAGLCNGILKPTSGVVAAFSLDTRGDVNVQKQLRARVGHVMQNPEDQLFEQYVGDDIAFGPLKLGLTLDATRQRVKAAMTAVGLAFADKDLPLYALSRGQKRKVAIAGILAMEPELLILDEPTSGLDPLSGQELLQSLLQLNQENGTTLLIITHQLSEVLQLAQRVLVLEHGKICMDGDPNQLFLSTQELPPGLDFPDEVLIAQRLRQLGVQTSRNDWTAVGFAQVMIQHLSR